MALYCIDSNILIDAKNRFYHFDVFPPFWDWLDAKFRSGEIFSSSMVFDELQKQEDELADWAKERRQFFVQPDEKVQAKYAEIVNFVQRSYPERNTVHFLAKADPMLIAHAVVAEADIITFEQRVNANSLKVKIPNVLSQFSPNLRCIDLFAALLELKARFE